MRKMKYASTSLEGRQLLTLKGSENGNSNFDAHLQADVSINQAQKVQTLFRLKLRLLW